jgi:sulfatase modifying factor 1
MNRPLPLVVVFVSVSLFLSLIKPCHAQILVEVDPSKINLSWMNISTLPAGQVTYQHAFLPPPDYITGGWIERSNLSADFVGDKLTLTPTAHLVWPADDPFWVVNGRPNKFVDAVFYGERYDFAGNALRFTGFTLSNTLASGYQSAAFIKEFSSPSAGFVFLGATAVPLVGGVAFDIQRSIPVGNVVQWGFMTTGPNASPAIADSLGSVVIQVVPEPSAYALLIMSAAGALWFTRKRRAKEVRTLSPVAAVLFAAFAVAVHPAAHADTFGSVTITPGYGVGPVVGPGIGSGVGPGVGSVSPTTNDNTFAIDFIDIGNAGNAADTTGYGAVPYQYRIGKYEISQDAITKATASEMANVTAGAWTGNQPAANISWYEAAAFVNWLNTSTGKQAAYDLAWTGSAWSMNLWSSAQAWQVGGENLYRNKDAFYFLPSEDEWYKAAYYSPAQTSYYIYPTASDSQPQAVLAGTASNTAVYAWGNPNGPAAINNAGSLSAYATMAQGGNAAEFTESSYAGTNTSASEYRSLRGGSFGNSGIYLTSSYRDIIGPNDGWDGIGFRVASVPESSTYALLLVGTGALWWARRRR